MLFLLSPACAAAMEDMAPVAVQPAPATAPAEGSPPQGEAAPPQANIPPDAPQTAAPETAVPDGGPVAPPITGSVETPPKRHHAKGDPLEGINRGMFSVHQALDKAILRPLAVGSGKVLPKPVRSGLHNIFVNLTEPIVFLNDLLQLRPGRAIRTLARFTLNASVGIGGLFDIAKHENLPHRENGFGDTLGYYGVGPGPYIFLPLLGPTTLRDVIGGRADHIVLPLAVGTPFDRAEYQASTIVLSGLDQRLEADADLKALLDGAVDPYATLRSVYLQDRAAEIAGLKAKGKGEPALPDIPMEDPLRDPAAAAEPAPDQAASPAPQPAQAP